MSPIINSWPHENAAQLKSVFQLIVHTGGGVNEASLLSAFTNKPFYCSLYFCLLTPSSNFENSVKSRLRNGLVIAYLSIGKADKMKTQNGVTLMIICYFYLQFKFTDSKNMITGLVKPNTSPPTN